MMPTATLPARPDVIPRIDVSALAGGRLDSSEGLDVQAQLRAACAEVGFMTVVGHGVSLGLIADAAEAGRRFFAHAREANLRAAPRRWNPESPNV